MHERERVVVDGLDEIELCDADLEEVNWVERPRFALQMRPTRPFNCGAFARAVEEAELCGAEPPPPPNVNDIPTVRPRT